MTGSASSPESYDSLLPPLYVASSHEGRGTIRQHPWCHRKSTEGRAARATAEGMHLLT